ncbi:hypothetical protein OGAPHI_007208 [Ogataea philodendri]|uniref:cystathionine gamma-synthase n=1 Tax=Ogataea philodendri TaxID=1378263 RepID=A0A9P8SYT1_9ASCO|nr:uncharacterized protein OGAPHI_007208 [Ogataea philodendri]KAH3660003.1 hypothetical protein OGAPHI_007208 [Ogataea philodendri]
MPISQAIGAPIPNNTDHAVSVTLPTWEATVGYEEGQDWVVNKMHSGYPRFFVHSKVKELSRLLELNYAKDNEKSMIFPTYEVAKRCREFIKSKTLLPNCSIRILQLSTAPPKTDEEKSFKVETQIAVVFFPGSEFSLAKAYWQHTGEGVSSRLGEYVLNELGEKLEATASKERKMTKQNSNRSSSGRNSRSSISSLQNNQEYSTFIEERFGRNLDLRFAKEAKSILRHRIATTHSAELSDDDVYLCSSGMTAIFTAHHLLLNTMESKDLKSVCFGFPYVDTLNILKKWGAGVHFYGFGDDDSLDDLEKRLEGGERILSLFCECPSNPLLKTPDLIRIKKLGDKYNFVVVVDDTVGNMTNLNVLPYTDIVTSSLTKVFSGDSNVMGGSLVLNPKSNFYAKFKEYLDENFEDLLWAQDAIYLERNSRDFEARSKKINHNAIEVLKFFEKSPLLEQVYYPSTMSSKNHYDALKKADGGYGGLMSIVFKDQADAVCFFNNVKLSKGPSLGTNFTLICPYSILAHYQELDEIEQWGVDRNLVRLSIGLEPTQELLETLKEALDSSVEQHNV